MTIKSLIKENKIKKSNSDYYLIKKKKVAIIESELYNLTNELSVSSWILDEKKLNIIGLTTVCFILTQLNKKNLVILKCFVDSKHFQIDYMMNKNEKSVTRRIIDRKLLILLKSKKYICYPKNNFQSSFATNTIKFENKQLNNYFLVFLAKNIFITQNHSLSKEKCKSELELKYIRITGVCKDTKKNLQKYNIACKAAKSLDHRQLNNEAEIYVFDKRVGSGLPLMLENGVYVETAIEEYFRNSVLFKHVKFISTPVLGSKKLYELSGHWWNYQSSMFPPISHDESAEKLILRPMTCPHHCIVFKNRKYFADDLPITYCENAILFRYEASGALLGLERTRQMKLFDSHTFTKQNRKLVCEALQHDLVTAIKVLRDFKIKIWYFRLSINKWNVSDKDSGKYINDEDVWNKANLWIEEVLIKEKITYVKKSGHAAFYGPKIDIQIKTITGAEITLATIQLDLFLAERLSCSYGDKKYPAIIHTGFIGTYERFISILLEQNHGFLPFLCNPYQVVIIPLSKKFNQSAEHLAKQFKKINVKCTINNSDLHINAKIKDVYRKKATFFTVIGNKEIESQNYNLETTQTRIKHVININNLNEIYKFT